MFANQDQQHAGEQQLRQAAAAPAAGGDASQLTHQASSDQGAPLTSNGLTTAEGAGGAAAGHAAAADSVPSPLYELKRSSSTFGSCEWAQWQMDDVSKIDDEW